MGGWLTFYFYQLGYTKKQEERHFRGVITLEVCAQTLSLNLHVIYSTIIGFVFLPYPLKRAI